MISYVCGELTEILDGTIVVETCGIGYNIVFPDGFAAKLPEVGSQVKIYTYLSVREDAMNLYGFFSRAEVELFKKIISVSGIGPKGGQGILASMDISELRFAILSGDAKTISKCPGIGAKTASKLILELKDKIEITDASQYKDNSTDLAKSHELEDALEALEQLGFSRSEGMKAVRAIDNIADLNSEQIIKFALKSL